jgi:NADH dehydrogenase
MCRVVVLGGGYAGLHAFRALRKSLPRSVAGKPREIVWVSKDPAHTYHGWTGEILSGRLPIEMSLTPLEPLSVGGRFVHGAAVSVDRVNRTVRVRCADGDEWIGYDHLVVATGSRDPFARVPGLAEYGWCLKDQSDFRRLDARLAGIEAGFASAPPAGPFDVVVVGAGFSGMETASALAQRFARFGKVRVHVVGSGDALLPSARPEFAKFADFGDRFLRDLGVTVHFGRRVAEVLPDRVAFSDGTHLPSDMAIVTAGISFETLPGTEGLERSPEGRIVVDGSMRAVGTDDVWAAGDVALVPFPGRDETCPSTAIWAIRQGAAAGANIARTVRGRPTEAFAFKGFGQAAGLGPRTAIGELHGIQLAGRLACVLRIGVFYWFMPSRRAGLRVVRKLMSRAA